MADVATVKLLNSHYRNQMLLFMLKDINIANKFKTWYNLMYKLVLVRYAGAGYSVWYDSHDSFNTEIHSYIHDGLMTSNSNIISELC